MSNLHDVCFVTQITLNSITYYYCSASRMQSISLSGSSYLPYILSVGNTEKIGNFGEGNQIGKCNMVLMLGQKQYQGNYNIDITLPWNNGTCEIRIYDLDNDSSWSDCDSYYKGTIKGLSISDDNLSFNIEDMNQKDNVILPKNTVEDAVANISYLSANDIPSENVGKRVPMQFGYLDSVSNGVFAKGIAISNRVGMQELVFDTEPLYQFNLTDGLSGIGIWEEGMKKAFIAKYIHEHRIKDSNNNAVLFSADTSTTLALTITDTTSDTSLITINDYTKITDLWYEDSGFSKPELITGNIIAIDNEFMLIIEKPTSNEIWVNRGFNDSAKATHTAGSIVYWCASYAAKNLLSFTEKFVPTHITNLSKEIIVETGATTTEWNQILSGSISNLANNDTTDSVLFKINKLYYIPTVYDYVEIYFDMQFTKIKDSSIATGDWFSAIKCSFGALYNAGAPYYYEAAWVYIFDPPGDPDTSKGRVVFRPRQEDGRSVDWWSTLVRNGDVDGYDGNVNLTGTISNAVHPNNVITATNLQDLNKRWRCSVNLHITENEMPQNEVFLRLYNIGFWIDFYVDYTKHKIMGTLQGRKKTATLDTIFQTVDVGSLAVWPFDVIALILTTELGYTSTGFDYASWRFVRNYILSVSSGGVYPQIAMSYGIDESEKGWDLCQNIASQFGLMLIKSDNGKIRIVSNYYLQDKGEHGYNTATAYSVSIDDIIISGGRKQISLQQTGTDRLRNVIKINYKRNNSTNEYQSVYPEAQADLDSYVLTESGNTLSESRSIYNSGQKTETLEINAFAIYQEEDAEKLAKWHLNDKAENHFDVTVSLPYYHYTDVNSKSSQYDVGDIIYLDGIYQGITFNSTHKFVVQQINKTNQGRQIELAAKSIQPVSEF